VVVEIVDDALEVYNVLDFVNTQQSPVDPGKPIVFELPDDAKSLTILENSSPQAKAAGRVVTVTGPFAPGRTPIQFAYQLPYSSSRTTLRQVMPLALPQVSLLVRHFDGVQFASAQAGDQREVTLDGHPYIASTGPAVPAGQAIELNFSGLPHHVRWPRWLALALAALVAAGGVWFASGKPESIEDVGRQKLEARREQLLAELVKLEEQHLAGRGDPHRYAARRRELVAQLEQVYSNLGGGPAPEATAPSLGAGHEGEVPVEASVRTGRA
jgi:hypothetical protein